MEDIEKMIEELQGIYPLNDYGFQRAMQDNLRGFQDMCGEAADALKRLLAENERLRSNCYAMDGVEAIIRERDAYRAQLAAERAKYAELQRYNVDCTKACDRQMVEILELREQSAQFSEAQRRERAAVEDLYMACKHSPCNTGICVKKNCTGNHIPCEFEWRGPGAGEGDNNGAE